MGRISAMDGMMQPWVEVSPPEYAMLPARLVIRRAHVQPRYGDDMDSPLEDAWWLYPGGGMVGKLFPLPLPAGAGKVDKGEEEHWAAGLGAGVAGAARPGRRGGGRPHSTTKPSRRAQVKYQAST